MVSFAYFEGYITVSSSVDIIICLCVCLSVYRLLQLLNDKLMKCKYCKSFYRLLAIA